MKRQPTNKICRTAGPKATVHILAATFALGAMLALPAWADNLNPPTGPGGIQIQPTVNISGVSNVTIGVEGLQAPYAVEMAPLGSSNWTAVGATSIKYPNSSGSVVVTNVPDGAQFRACMLGSTNWVGKWNTSSLAVSNAFVGSSECLGCHSDKVTDWSATAHSRAYANATSFPLVSRTVGNGQPGGFVDMAATPHLAGVQCENCHGSANAHINISGRTYHPINSLAAETCGSCHDTEKSPIFDEWVESPHHHQDSHIVDYFVGPDSESRQASCGACHSTATRMAMLSNLEDMKNGMTNYLAIPSAIEATNFATASCAVCHDPHAISTNGWSAQMRNPLYSTNFFTLTTTTSSTNIGGKIYYRNTFASQYKENVQICGQCHNTRGAKWTDYSRPPHHSPQYNMLIGTVQEGYLATNLTSRHGGITRSSTTGIYNTNQCVTCHVVSHAPMTNGLIVTTNYSGGHSFEVNYNGCALAGCHTSEDAASIKHETEVEQGIRKTALSNVVAKLNQWATDVAPTINPAFATYGQYAWEYTTAGQLSNPNALTNIVGPPTSLQTNGVPNEIKQARFNLYMVEHDGSYGIHNRQLTPLLLTDAETKVNGLLGTATNKAFFNVSSTNAFTATNVAFTTYGSAGTTYSWDFGDGSPASTNANPTHAFAAAGPYTITLTANGTDTFSRTINVYANPTVSFTAGPLTGPAPLTVTFTNTSVNTASVTAWRWTVRSGVNITTNASVFSYTYTAAGSNNVALRATTPVGNTTTTVNNYIIVTP